MNSNFDRPNDEIDWIQTFHDPSRIVLGEDENFKHFFGGSPVLANPEVLGERPPFHLLFDLDLNDPCLAHLHFLRIERLMLVYPLRYEHEDLSYELDQQGRLSLLKSRGKRVPLSSWDSEPEPDWPTTNYPVAFDRQPISIRPFVANGDEEISKLTLLFDLKETEQPSRKLVLTGDKNSDLDEFEMISNFDTQRNDCVYRDCVSANGRNNRFPFAAIPSRALPGTSIWGEYGEYVWIIFEVCEGCGTISNYNVCD